MILEVLVLLAQRLASTTDQNLEHRGAVVAAPPLAAAAAMSVCAAAALASEKADAVAGDVAAAVADEPAAAGLPTATKPAAAGMSPIHSRWNAKSSTAAWDVLADPVPESSVLLATSVPVCRTARCPPPHTASHLAQPASREAEALVPDAQHAPAVGREAEISLATAFV
jgi:hypothetical protein